MASTNPARLLHRNLGLLLSNRADRDKVRDVLAKCFDLNPGDDAQLRRALVALDEVFLSVEMRIKKLPKANHQSYMRHFPALRRGFANLTLDNPSPHAFNFITDAALENLELAANRIAEDFSEVEIETQEISDLSSAVLELLEWVSTATMDPALKEVAIDLLETLRRAISEYRIRGVEGLQRAVQESLGKLTLFYKQRKGDVEAEPFQKLWGLLVKAEGVVSRAMTYGPYLVESFQRYLGAG